MATYNKMEDENKLMALNQNEQIMHHTQEFKSAIKKTLHIPAWIVAKVNRATTDLSDATHYLEGEGKKYAEGGGIGSFYNKAKSLGQKGVDATKKAIHDKQKNIALNVLWETKENLAKGNERKATEMAYSIVEKRYAEGGGVMQLKHYANGANVLPTQGSLVTHNKKLKLDYKKVGNNYEFVVYEGESKPFENYSKTTFKKRDKNVVTMDYKQFIDYLSEFAKGGNISGVLKINPEFTYKKIINDWFEDNSQESLKYKIAVDLLKGEDDIDVKYNIELPRYASLLRSLDSIDINSKHEMSWRTLNYTIGEAEEWAKESLKRYFVLEYAKGDYPLKYAKGGGVGKVDKVMHEFKQGDLHSGKSGKIVKNPKQAIAIALSEAGLSKKRTGWKHKTK